MKYIKLFESEYKRKKPRVGDYVICTDLTRITEDFKNWLQNNIGQIFEVDREAENQYGVKYSSIPDRFDIESSSNENRWFCREEILYHSPNKEELELILAAKNYNL